MSEKTSDIAINDFARRWFIVPAVFWLVVVTLSGAWIRHIWAYPGTTIVDPKHLTHAHSHVALLGWCWSIVAAYLLRNIIKPVGRLVGWKLFAILFHVSVGGMFVTFSMNGYWKWSIIFSAMHVLLGSGLVVAYFTRRAKFHARPALIAFDASMLLVLIANIAPMMLSMGSMQTASFVTIAVNAYVHLHCFGFLLLFMLGMLFDKVLVASTRSEVAKQSRLIYLLAFSVIPAQLVAVSHLIEGNLDMMAGAVGMAFYAAGLVYLIRLMILNWKRVSNHGCGSMMRVVLIAVTALAFALALASVPAVSDTFRDARYLVIGVIHLLLLGIVTPVFLYYGHRSVGLTDRDVKKTVVILVVSIWVMVSVLVLAGIGQGLGFILPMNVPKTLFLSAIPITAATAVLFYKVYRSALKSAI